MLQETTREKWGSFIEGPTELKYKNSFLPDAPRDSQRPQKGGERSPILGEAHLRFFFRGGVRKGSWPGRRESKPLPIATRKRPLSL